MADGGHYLCCEDIIDTVRNVFVLRKHGTTTNSEFFWETGIVSIWCSLSSIQHQKWAGWVPYIAHHILSFSNLSTCLFKSVALGLQICILSAFYLQNVQVKNLVICIKFRLSAFVFRVSKTSTFVLEHLRCLWTFFKYSQTVWKSGELWLTCPRLPKANMTPNGTQVQSGTDPDFAPCPTLFRHEVLHQKVCERPENNSVTPVQRF